MLSMLIFVYLYLHQIPQALQNASIIFKYFPDLTDHQKNQVEKLEPLYREWNERINVISRKDIDNLFVNHVLHSLAIAKIISFKPGANILDIGTGGGFPGIPLAILFPQTNFHLVDSIGKKITVVKNVVEGLGLTNVKAEQVRGEEIKAKYDFVISRAVTRMREFYGWVRNKTTPQSIHSLDNGILYLKGGDLDEELDELGTMYAIYELPDYFEEDFFLTKKLVFIPL